MSPLCPACEAEQPGRALAASWHHSLTLEIVLQGFSPSHLLSNHKTFLHPSVPTVYYSSLCLPWPFCCEKWECLSSLNL